MQERKSYLIRPLQHGVSTEGTDFNLPFPYGSWGSKNFRIFQSNPRKRWGYDTADRDGLTGIQQVVLFTVTGSSRYTLYLTDTELCQKETASALTGTHNGGNGSTTLVDTTTNFINSGVQVGDVATNSTDSCFGTVTTITKTTNDWDTLNFSGGLSGGTDNDFDTNDEYSIARQDEDFWSYQTLMADIDDSVASISGTTVTFKSNTVVKATTEIAINDYFVLDQDRGSASVENAGKWAKISAVNDDGTYYTTLTIASYGGSTGTWTGSEKDCLIRNVYTTPSNERWWWAVVNNTFCFGNGSTYIQKYTGSTTANLDATYAIQARYGIEFANRLVFTDYGSPREPQSVRWSASGDSTDYTAATSGSTTFTDSRDYITGLGKVGANLIVYFRDGIRLGYATGAASTPIGFAPYYGGIGLEAPYSLVEANGTNYFIGKSDFYEMVSGRAQPFGKGIRDKFFSIVGATELKRTFGFELSQLNLVVWVANTTEGKLGFAFDYEKREWDVFEWGNDITGFGKGAI